MSDEEKRVTARARVTVTVDMDCTGLWGPECTVDQIHKQAKEEARMWLSKMLEYSKVRVKIIEMHATSVSMEEKR